MSTSKAGREQIANYAYGLRRIMILHRLACFVMTLERHLAPASCVDDADRNFLQMLIDALIIAKRKLYERVGRDAPVELVREIFDLICHGFSKVSTDEQRHFETTVRRRSRVPSKGNVRRVAGGSAKRVPGSRRRNIQHSG